MTLKAFYLRIKWMRLYGLPVSSIVESLIREFPVCEIEERSQYETVKRLKNGGKRT